MFAVAVAVLCPPWKYCSCKRIRGWIVVIAEVAVSDFMPRGNGRPSRPAFSL